MSRIMARLAAVAGLAACAAAATAQASSIEVLSYSAVAQSTCATSGPVPGHADYAFTVPYATGCPGQNLQTATAASGPITVSSSGSVTNAVSSFSPAWSATVSSSATANIGSLGARATGTLDGATDGFSWHGTEATARFTQNMTIGAGVGASMAHFAFTVDGMLDWTVHGDGQLVLSSTYTGLGSKQIELRLDYGVSGLDVLLEGNYRYLPPFVNTLPPEIVLTGSGYQVNGLQVVVDVPFVYGAAFDLTVELTAVSLPGPSPDPGVAPSVITSDFFSTARLTSVSVDGNTGFVIATDNGVLIDGDGVHLDAPSVPEPGTLAGLVVGLAGLALLRRRRIG